MSHGCLGAVGGGGGPRPNQVVAFGKALLGLGQVMAETVMTMARFGHEASKLTSDFSWVVRPVPQFFGDVILPELPDLLQAEMRLGGKPPIRLTRLARLQFRLYYDGHMIVDLTEAIRENVLDPHARAEFARQLAEAYGWNYRRSRPWHRDRWRRKRPLR